jgi:hypothetical protein
MNNTAATPPTMYDETRAAVLRAGELLTEAAHLLSTAEGFAETGTHGKVRDAVIGELKRTRQDLHQARRHADDAAYELSRGAFGVGDEIAVRGTGTPTTLGMVKATRIDANGDTEVLVEWAGPCVDTWNPARVLVNLTHRVRFGAADHR